MSYNWSHDYLFRSCDSPGSYHADEQDPQQNITNVAPDIVECTESSKRMGTLKVVVAQILITTEVEDLKWDGGKRENVFNTNLHSSYYIITIYCTLSNISFTHAYSLFCEHQLEGRQGVEYSYGYSVPVREIHTSTLFHQPVIETYTHYSYGL